MSTSPSPVTRILHQLRTDWRHLRYACALFYLWLVLKTVYELHHHSWLFSDYLDTTVQGLTLGAVVCLAFVMAWADAPANTDTASLTRPLGRRAQWLGKVLFALLGIVLPLLVSEAVTWVGFDLTAGQWLALSAGTLLMYGITIALSATIAGTAAGFRQAMIAASLSLILGGLWWFSGTDSFTWLLETAHLRPESPAERYGTMQDCGHLIGCVLLLAGAVAAWWLTAVPRCRWWAVLMVVAALVQRPIVMNLWRTPDWLAVAPQVFPRERLTIKTGPADPQDKSPGRSLWPTLRLTGLKADEVPSIMGFGPVPEKGQPWPPLGSHTDLPKASNWPACWMPYDHLRSISKHFASTDLWNDNWVKQSAPRAPLATVMKPLKLDPQAPLTPWQLRLAMHEMRKIGEAPLQQVWSSGLSFVIEPGLRLEVGPVVWIRGGNELKGRFHSLSSRFLPATRHLPLREQFRDAGFGHLTRGLFVVLRDNESHEVTSYEAGMSDDARESFAFREHRINNFETRFWGPRSRLLLLGEKLEDCIARTTVSFWIPEERGTVDVQLSAEQMKQVLTPAVPSPPVRSQ